jgi:hypothetical protein
MKAAGLAGPSLILVTQVSRVSPPATGEGATGASLIQRRQIERAVDQRRRALEIEIAIDVLLHDRRRAAVELFVLLVAAAEFGAEEVPQQPHQRGPRPRVHGARAHIALDQRRDVRIVEIGQ